MSDQEIENIRWIYRIVLNVSAIGLWFWRPRWKDRFWKWLPLYVTGVAIGEWAGYYLRLHKDLQDVNPFFYSFFQHPLIFISLFWFLGQYDKQEKRKSNLWLYASGILLLACAADCYYFMHHPQRYWLNNFSYSTGTLLLLVLLLRFFFGYIFSQKIIRFTGDIMFWFCLALFLYYAGTLPFFALRNTLASFYYKEIFVPYFVVQLCLATILYVSLLIMYACIKPK